MSRNLKPAKRATATSVRNLNYATSPLLASKTPPWRSRFVVALVGLAFAVLVGRAVYIQIIGTDFYQQQGDKRYGHVIEVPASRGRILDRNGQVLATSVPVPSIWAIPKDFAADVQQRKALARLLEMKPLELEHKLEGSRNFTWLKRQVDEPLWAEVKALGLKGVHQLGEYRRKYPEGESAAHIVGFTNIEDKGQEGIELAFQEQLQGRDGQRAVIKDRLGRVIEDGSEQLDPVNGRDIQLSIDSKVQFFAYQRVRDAVAEHNAKAGSVVVLDVITGEVLALANYPSYDPGNRRKLSGEQLRNRALTDTFEPGSTMKPLVAAWALETKRVRSDTVINTAPGSLVVGPLVVKDAHPHAALTVEQVIQKSSNVGAARLAMQMPRASCGSCSRPSATARSRRSTSPARSPAGSSPTRTGGRSSRRPWPTATACRPRCCRWRAPTPAWRVPVATSSRSRCSSTTRRWMASGSIRRPRPRRCAACCSWLPARAAPHRGRRRWAIRWAARAAPRTSRRARATRPTSTAPGSSAWRRSATRASSSR